MATKIDLLPGYVKLTKRFRFTIGAAIVGVGLWTGALLLIYHSKQLELGTATQNANDIKPFADKKTQADSARDTALGEASVYSTANQFMLASCKTGSERAALINLLIKYIYINSVVKSIKVLDGKTVTIEASVATPDDYYTFLNNIRRAKGVVFLDDPTLSGIGGFANGAAPLVLPTVEDNGAPAPITYPINFTATATLINQVTEPLDPSGGAGTGAATGAPGGGPSPAPTGPPRG